MSTSMEASTTAEKRGAESQPQELPAAKQRAVEDDIGDMSGDDGGAVVATSSEQPPVSSETAAMLAAFNINFRRELDDALPEMVGRALGNVLEPMQQRQRKLGETTEQLRKDVSRLHEAQTSQAIKMDRQMAELTAAVKALAGGNAAGTGVGPTEAGRAACSTGQPSSSAPSYATHAGARPGASGVQGGTSSSAAASAQGEHLVLMKFTKRTLRPAMEGVERSARSRMGFFGAAPTYSGKRYHTHLTLHFATHNDAESCANVFRKAGIQDIDGGEVIYSHKGRIDTRPMPVRRRGAAMAPIHEVLETHVSPGEKLEQAHETKDTDQHTIFYAVNETQDAVRELVRVHWVDDEAMVKILRFGGLAADISDQVRKAAERAAGL